MESPIDGGSSFPIVVVRKAAFANEACIFVQADDNMMSGMAVACCYHMNWVDLSCVRTAGDLCHVIGYDDHCCRVPGSEVMKVACCHLLLDYDSLTENRICDSSEDSCRCSNSVFDMCAFRPLLTLCRSSGR